MLAEAYSGHKDQYSGTGAGQRHGAVFGYLPGHDKAAEQEQRAGQRAVSSVSTRLAMACLLAPNVTDSALQKG